MSDRLRMKPRVLYIININKLYIVKMLTDCFLGFYAINFERLKWCGVLDMTMNVSSRIPTNTHTHARTLEPRHRTQLAVLYLSIFNDASCFSCHNIECLVENLLEHKFFS